MSWLGAKKLVTWKRLGFAGFLFFLVKGLAWLVAAGFAVRAVT